MPNLSARQQLFVGIALLVVMAATRSHHFVGALHFLPDASWAAFFLAGALLGRAWIFALFCVLAAGIDWVAINLAGVSGFCVTPAYAMLLPAYGALWLAGRWFVKQRRIALLPFLGAALVSAAAAELFSSGGFYLLGGRFAEPNLAEFLQREAEYFPAMAGAMMLYLGLAALAYLPFAKRSRPDADGPRTLMPGIRN
jgi:hypothetical protein